MSDPLVSLTREEADEVAYLLRASVPSAPRTALLRKLSEALHPRPSIAEAAS